MRWLTLLCLLVFLCDILSAQYVYTIKADSVKITDCDSVELILENHTQNIPGFLFNTGNGRTVFKRGAIRINGSMYVVGGDAITIPQPNTNFWSLNGNVNTSPATQYIGTSDGEPPIFGALTNVLVSDANGNVFYRSASNLVGNEAVRSSLAVKGAIRSKKIIISPDEWADYVFDSSYRLPQLNEVESYIHREHHLQGVASAASVQKDGLDVGEGQAALLKKIEELTLYTIELNKRLDEQQKEIENLKAKHE